MTAHIPHARAAVLAVILVVLGAAVAFAGAPLVNTAAVTVPTCTKPTSNVTAQKEVDYAQCLQNRTEALMTNLHPAPTVTETVTVTASPTASPTTATSSPSPSPTATAAPAPAADPAALKGWELVPSGTGANVGLAGVGLTCAGLPVYGGPTTIPAGTTITDKRFATRIDVSAGGITISRSCFRSSSPESATDGLVEGYYPQGEITIKDSEFDGSLLAPGDRDSACAFAGGANLIRNYIHDVGSGICEVSSTNTRNAGEVPHDILVKNNYAHNFTSCCGAHHEAGTIRDFVKNAANDRTMKWVGNWLDITQTEFVSGGMFIQPTFEPIYNVWLTDNVFAGEGFNLVTGDNDTVNVVRNLHVVNNRFKAGTREWYGPVDKGAGPGIVEWSENYLFDAAQPAARGQLVP